MITARIEQMVDEIVKDVCADSRESKMMDVQTILRRAANQIEYEQRKRKFQELKGAKL